MAFKLTYSRLWRHLVIIAVGFIMIYPILWLISSSFKPNQLIFSQTNLWPKEVTLQNYVKGWQGLQGISFGHFFLNSFIISSLSVVGNIVSCSLAAFAFARLNFKGKKLWFGLMLMTLMLPFQVTLIPQYVMFHLFGWINTFFPLVIPKWLASDSFFILLMVQFIRGIPLDLDESATMDGCGQTQIYFRIVLPLTVPAIITTAIFTFYWTWDDFFSQMIYLNSPKLFTVPIGLRSLIDASSTSDWGSLMAMSVLSLAPVIIIFLTFQKFIVQGIATTGIK
ncbi:MAG: sugar ABC transporter permease [Paenibacillus sp. RIFOXYA1_FULL_44_5]|nr:MAG: sugar ABC transporter permease [Paenibacillus sp. RIFOXYA1_FULL_44_5]